jgi:hypothetical protein
VTKMSACSTTLSIAATWYASIAAWSAQMGSISVTMTRAPCPRSASAQLRRVSVWLGAGYVTATFMLAPTLGAPGAALAQSGATTAKNVWAALLAASRARTAGRQ